METSIRFIRIEGRAIKPALCFRGRNQAHAVINDECAVRVVSNIPLKQHDSSNIVLGPHGYGHTEYPITLFVKRFEEIGKRKGITKRAQYLLDRALVGGIKDEEPLPPDEIEGKELPPAPPPALDAKPQERSGSRSAAAKPEKPASKSRSESVAGSRTAGADIVRKLSIEFKLEPPKLRKLLRSKGLHAPYDDEAKLRKALGK